MSPWGRAGYLAVTGLGTTAAGLAWWVVGPDHALPVALGLGTAWVLQAPAFWILAGRLARGEDAFRAWVGGIGARFGGLAVLAVAGGVDEASGKALLLAYGAAVLAQLLLEAVWLWKRQPRRGGPAGRAGRRAGTATNHHDS